MKIFVAYPYSLAGYKEALASSLPPPQYELEYADEHLASDHVLRKIERMLAECDLALFDVTGANPNVTLELGIAIATLHPYVVVIQRESVGTLNADIHGWDQLRYDTVEELSAVLHDRIERNRVPTRPPRATPTQARLWMYTEKPESVSGGLSMITLYPMVANNGDVTARDFTVRLYFQAAQAQPARRSDWIIAGTHTIPIFERHYAQPVYPGQSTALPFIQITTTHSFSTAQVAWAILWETGRFPEREGTFMPFSRHRHAEDSDVAPVVL